MRILITTDTVGGVWSYTEELVDGLAARGHHIALAVLGTPPAPTQRSWIEARPELDVFTLGALLEWMPEPEPALSASVAALRETVERVCPDAIHLNQFFYGAWELGAPKLVVAHSDVVSWWRAVRGEDPPDDSWFRRYHSWVRDGLAGADLRAAPSAWMAAEAEATYGVTGIRAVHCGRSSAPFAAAARARRDPLVVCAGRLWDEGKGVLDLVGAAEQLGDAGRVVVAGPTAHPAGGTAFPANARGIEWAGMLDPAELAALLGRAAIYAATSRYEPFGLAPLEAALAGCALVVSDISTFREVWEDCALFYPAGDSAALARALRELLRDDHRRAELADAARHRALTLYTPERMAEGYEVLYRELQGIGKRE